MQQLNPLVIITALFTVFGLIFFVLAIIGIKRKKPFAALFNILVLLLMVALSALFCTMSIAMQGYRALTKEEIAAIVQVDPLGEHKFRARFSMPNSSDKQFFLSGDQLYVDAHILKWKPLANIIGLHTSYELDRVAGRYTQLRDETSKPHTVYSLAKGRALNMFHLRQRFFLFNPLLDAQYGSATYITVNKSEELKVMVSTSGLLIRKSDDKPGM
jgi:hypothetical protein